MQNKLELFDLNGRVALVTGAARGNGFAIAKGLLSAGAKVFFIDINENTLQINVAGLKNNMALPILCDIRNDKEVDSALMEINSFVDSVDILVNNAGISLGGVSAEQYSFQDWKSTFEINLDAAFKLTQKVATLMIKKSRGSIINITSLGAELGFPHNPAYIAAKGALKMLSRSFAYDLAKYNIRVNNIIPGYIHTDMTNSSYTDIKLNSERLEKMLIKRWGEPEDLVGAAVFLASDASLYITGIDLPVDGGWLAKGL